MRYLPNMMLSILLLMVVIGCRESKKTEPDDPKENAVQKENQQSNGEENINQDSTSNKQVASDGAYSFERPEDFGLAASREQILTKSTIPPCPEGFEYCLYYKGKKYKNTNLESAAVGIYILENLSGSDCFFVKKFNGRKENLHIETINGIRFTVFSTESGAMARYVKDVVYQTPHNGKCYRFVVRIGVSQFQNYEPGTIEKFNREMELEMINALKNIVHKIKFIVR